MTKNEKVVSFLKDNNIDAYSFIDRKIGGVTRLPVLLNHVYGTNYFPIDAYGEAIVEINREAFAKTIDELKEVILEDCNKHKNIIHCVLNKIETHRDGFYVSFGYAYNEVHYKEKKFLEACE